MTRKLTNNISGKNAYFQVFTDQGNSPRPVPAPTPLPNLPSHVDPGKTIMLNNFTSRTFWLVIAVQDSAKFKFWGNNTTIVSVTRKEFDFKGKINVQQALVIEILSSHKIDNEKGENGDMDHEDMHVGSEDDKP